eukprot:SAG22_NODE_921_length_6492_cov_5.072423_4_plen_70_part_00
MASLFLASGGTGSSFCGHLSNRPDPTAPDNYAPDIYGYIRNYLFTELQKYVHTCDTPDGHEFKGNERDK